MALAKLTSASAEPMKSRSALGVATFISIIDAIGFGMLIPVLPFLVLHFGANPALVTQLVAIAGLATFLGSPFVGYLADRFGRLRVLGLTLAGSVVAQAGMLLAWSLPGLFVFRALGGALSGRGGLLRTWITDDAEPEQHVRRISWLATATNIGAVMGPVLGGLLGLAFNTSELHFKAVLIASLGLAAVAFLVTLIAIRDWSPAASSLARPDQRRLGRGPLLTVLRPLIVVMLTSYAVGVILSTTALLVHERFSWKETQTGVLLGMTAAIMIFARIFVLPRMLAAFSHRRTLLLSLAVGAPTLGLLGATQDAVVFVALLALFCVTLSVTSVLPFAQVSVDAPPAHRGQIMGWAQGLGAVATAISASASGPLFAYVGPGAPHLVGASGLALCLLITALTDPGKAPGAVRSSGPEAPP